MEMNEEVAFREASEELVALHSTLIQAGNIVTDEGQRFNYAYLEDRDHATDVRMHVLWAREYCRLLETAVGAAVSERYLFSPHGTYAGLADQLAESGPSHSHTRPFSLSVKVHAQSLEPLVVPDLGRAGIAQSWSL